jgi:hypothetical protein
MYIFFGTVVASMILELRKEVLAHLLQGSQNENDYHYQKGSRAYAKKLLKRA